MSATEGQLVTMNCSVNYHCPSRLPDLQWRWERGAQKNITEPGEVQTLYPDPHRKILLASLTFTVTHQVKPKLSCQVSFPGPKTLSTLKDLHVTCKYRFDSCICVPRVSKLKPFFFPFNALSSSKRCEDSSPDPDSEGGEQCTADVLM